jgi:hypothetical protein
VPSVVTPVDKVTQDMVLQAVPKLRTGEWLPISDAAKALHDQKLLSKSASSVKLFKRFPNHFELKPAEQPNQVRYLVPGGASVPAAGDPQP